MVSFFICRYSICRCFWPCYPLWLHGLYMGYLINLPSERLSNGKKLVAHYNPNATRAEEREKETDTELPNRE